MSIGLTLIFSFIGYLVLLLSQRSWSLLSILIIFEIIWAFVSLYLSWYSIEISNLGVLFWAITTLYLSAVELTLALVTVLLYSDLIGQSKLW